MLFTVSKLTMKEIKAYTLFDEWKLYESNTWTDWILSFIRPLKKSIEDKYKNKDYLFDENTGELFDTNNIKVGQFRQETYEPYIYMIDSSYIRVLPEYESIIKETSFAKKCHKIYLENKLNDI